MNNENKNKEALIIKHYTYTNKNIFNFLADFFGNKFYNIIYNLSVQYTQKNNLPLERNYISIIENYLDSLIIKNKHEEDKKGKIIANFVKILYENYMKFINNQMIEMDEFLLKIVQSFLPSHHRNEIYIKDKNNIAVMFHTIILNISEDIIEFIKDNLYLILDNRVKENLVILKKDCIYIFCKVKENLENNFTKIETEDLFEQEETKKEEIDYEEIIKNSELYKKLEEKNNIIFEENKKLKLLIKELISKNNKLNIDMSKLKKLLCILNNKIKNNHISNSNQKNVNDILNNTNTNNANTNTTNINNTNINNANDSINIDLIESEDNSVKKMGLIDDENPFNDLLEND